MMKFSRLTIAAFGVLAVSLAFGQSTATGEATASLPAGNAEKGNAAALLATETYISPPNIIADYILSPRHKNFTYSNLSPNGTQFLLTESMGMQTVADMGKPWHNLAGIQIDPAANRSRSMTTGTSIGFTLYDWKTEKRTSVEVPKGARVGSPTWSSDGSKLAFLVHEDNASHLAVADVNSGKTKVWRTALLATLVTRPEWSGDGKWLFAVTVPDKRAELKNSAVATQPILRLSEPTKNPTRTYRSLLTTSHDQDLLEYFTTGQLMRFEVDSAKTEKIGEPKMYRSIDPSPDAKYVRATTMLKPFSYIVPASSFGSLEEIVDLSGKQVVEIRKQNLRLGSTGGDSDFASDETVPYVPPHYDWSEQVLEELLQGRGGGQGRSGGQAGGGAPTNTGRRNLQWAPDGNGLVFLQLQPLPQRQEGEAPTPVGRRKDRLMRWVAPYGKDDQKVIYEVEGSISSAQFGSDGGTLFVTESSGGNSTTYAVNLSDVSKKVALMSVRTPEPPAGPGATPRPGATLNDNSYENPGTWVTKANKFGLNTVRVSPKGEVFLSGIQYSRDPEKEAPRPFLDAVSLADGKKRRVWQSDPNAYETISGYLDDEGSKLMLTRQSPSMIANSFLMETGGGSPRQLTHNTDFIPRVTMAQRRRMQVERADGFKFWVEVTLPVGHIKGDRLPAFFWFYPSEFTDQASYDRTKRTFNKNLFPAVGATSKDLLILMGYAVVEPDCPIVGPQGRMNDRYVPDLRANLYATINKLDEEGLIDRSRLGIGGHSYGAFSTANAMVHTPFFKAGIAGDGAYNRMLTPMAFQSETRLLWDARETYLTMSPLLYAEQLNGALLMYHGVDDQNVGTDPINSERMFHALDGLGKDVALYMYPYEDHGQVAMETVLDQWARWVAWLDKYLKGTGK